MEGSALQKQNQYTPRRKYLASGSHKDLWFVVQEGSLAEVDLALLALKKNGGNINSRNNFGLTPLHIATWRNHIPIVRRLLAAGADPDARDGESGWSSLHRALHFGHLAVASVLLQSGASLIIEDSKCRTPVDLLTGPVMKVVGDAHDSVSTEVFSWGSGANYQLGTGNAHIQKLPCKVDTLQGSNIRLVSAAKFHSVAVGARGEVYTWGFGRGGRLGHPDFDIHSGQAAVITPRQVTSGLGSRRVKAIAAAKHHTVIATEGGEVFTWGSNREGQLGYPSVDTQPTPRRVSSLRTKVVAVAAANKHTAVVSETGEVFTWGCNKEGQLGYGTSNSASNYTPRVVEYLKGKVLTGVSAAKYHTIVLGADGEVFTWGHRLVTPRRVVIARNVKKSGTAPLKFHRMKRLNVIVVAAGMVHSMALTDDGALFYWVSSDPDLRSQQLYSLCGRSLVSISAGKYWTAVVTTTGDVYMWDGKKGKGEPPVVTRLQGVKRATSVSVGETHMLISCALYHPVYPPNMAQNSQKPLEFGEESDELNEDFIFNDIEDSKVLSTSQVADEGSRSVPSLKFLCEEVAAKSLVEPRNCIQLLEIADCLEADDLRKHCQEMAIRNLDYILTVSAQAIASVSAGVLVELEKLLDLKSCEPWSYRRLPTPTATFPAVINSEEEESESDNFKTRENSAKPVSFKDGNHRPEYFLQPHDVVSQGISKQVRALRKKLQQIEMLENKQSHGHILDDQQISKLQTKSAIENSLAELGAPVDMPEKDFLFPDVKASRKMEVSRKQRRKSKQKIAQVETSSRNYVASGEMHPTKGFLDVETPQLSKHKEIDFEFEDNGANQVNEQSSFCILKKDCPEVLSKKSAVHIGPKKKNKKGGLSMFLSGALDDVPKSAAPPPPPPPLPKTEGPAWGGAKVSKGPTSLRDIQDEQSKTKESQPNMIVKNQGEDFVEGNSAGQIRLSSLLPVRAASNPIPVISVHASSLSDGERSTPSWAAAGTSPIFTRPSLRDIQMQQGKHQQPFSHSPKTRTAGFSVTSGQGSPSDSAGPTRWFKPEVDTPSSLRSIQIEERAMKDLKRFYSNVKLVKNQT